jgi:outer membrane receptor protein involved in Fe transport
MKLGFLGVSSITIFAILLLGANSLVTAQDADPPPSKSTGPTGGNLQQIVVSAGIPPEDSILPTAVPTDAVLGTSANILDIPRGVSRITESQLQARQIEDVVSLSQFASGVFTGSSFGAPSNPFIRGLPAEMYQNGQRLSYTFDSFIPSFNAVESIDVVKGPGGPVIGPSNLGVGGYVNFVTKAPYFDRWHGALSFTLGNLVEGGSSYLRPEWQLDFGGPLIKDKLAIRVSYLGREADTYYQNVKDHTQDIFAAVTFIPTSALSFDYTAQFYEERFNENEGFNRVTQQLIDSNTYIAGPITPDFFGFPSPIGGFVSPNANGTFKVVKLHNYQTLTSPQDSDYGKRFLTQLISKAQITQDFQIVWRTLFEDTETRKNEAYGYREYNPIDNVFDTRLELHWDLHLFESTSTENNGYAKDGKTPISTTVEHPGIVNHFVAGASYRHEENRAYQDFTNETFVPYDLSQGPNFAVLPTNVIFGGRIIPGSGGYTATPSASVESHLNDFGFFIEDNIDLTKWLTVYLGGREDYISARSHQPELGTFLDGTGGTLAATPYRSRNTLNPSYFGSIVVKPASWLTTYVTYNKTNSVQGRANFGSIPNDFKTSQLANAVELYEAGIKASLFRNTLFASLTGYYETYYQYDLHNNRLGTQTRGLEVEAAYQPNKNFSATANFTWSHSNYTNAFNVFTESSDYLNAFAPPFVDSNGRGGKGGTSFLAFSPNFQGVTFKNSSPDVTGFPDIVFNAFATYQLDCGLGISVGPQVTGPMYANPNKTLKIPAQVTWNGAIFYKQKNFEIWLNFFNFTDERNFSPSYVVVQNDTILPNEPFHANLTIKLKF